MTQAPNSEFSRQFTTYYKNHSCQLINQVRIGSPIYHKDIENNEQPIELPQKEWNAQWDTGATGTCITKAIVEEYSLTPVSITRMSTPSGSCQTNVYLVDIYLPNKIIVPNVQVLEAILESSDMLIGMDIIGIGDFVVSSYNKKTMFSFRIPSLHDYDFTKYRYIPGQVMTSTPPRNQPCPCGSGKKYKNCCGR